MSYKTIETYVEVALDEWSDRELVDEMKFRGYTCTKDNSNGFSNEDWEILLKLLDSVPETWETRRVRDKVFDARFVR
jgi:hypothetical protein